MANPLCANPCPSASRSGVLRMYSGRLGEANHSAYFQFGLLSLRRFQECSAADAECQGVPGHLHIYAPETSQQPPPPGTDLWYTLPGGKHQDVNVCFCISLNSCFLIRSDRGKKCHTNSSIGSYILVLYNIIGLCYIELYVSVLFYSSYREGFFLFL